MSQRSISQRSRRNSRKAMRTAFEEYELSIYPDDPTRLARCRLTGNYISECVSVGFDDWKQAWGAGIQYDRASAKSKSNN